jgi:hypothetical protein
MKIEELKNQVERCRRLAKELTRSPPSGCCIWRRSMKLALAKVKKAIAHPRHRGF